MELAGGSVLHMPTGEDGDIWLLEPTWAVNVIPPKPQREHIKFIIPR